MKKNIIIKTPKQIKDYLDEYVIGHEDTKKSTSSGWVQSFKKINWI